MAKTPTTALKLNGQPLIPKSTDPRSELFWHLGKISEHDPERANRMLVLVVELTSPPASEV